MRVRNLKRLRQESEPPEMDDSDADRYKYNPNEFMNEFQPRLIHRPLPSVQAMLSVAHQGKRSDKIDPITKTSQIPILDDFFQHLKQRSIQWNPSAYIDKPQSSEETAQIADSSHSSPLEIRSTILTDGHHQRYKELLQIFGPLATQDAFSKLSYQNKIARKREWNTLKDMVTEERKQYALAWERFKQEHVHRFHIGFKVPSYISHFASMKAEYIESYKQRWFSSKIKPPLYYGTSVQNIYLVQNVPLDLNNLDTFAPKVLLRKRVGHGCACTIPLETLKQSLAGLKLSKSQVKNHLDSSRLLCEDESAKTLAKEHELDIVMTAKAMETMLRSNEWNLPILHIGKTVFIEDPVLTPTGPKECLSYGLTAGLIQDIIMVHSKTEISETLSGEYYYTALTLKARSACIKVLVRSFVSLQDNHGHPIVLDCNPKFFSELSEEEPSGKDRAYWLIQKLIIPDSALLACSIDVDSSSLSCISEKRIADALEVNETLAAESGLGTLGPFEAFLVGGTLEQSLQTLTNVLIGVGIIQKSDEHCLIILSETTNGIATVHRAVTEPSQNLIDITKQFQDSVNVFQNKTWLLLHEFSPWKWIHKRIPFSFQTQLSSELQA